MAEGMWELWDDAASLDSAATAWTRLSTALDDAGETLVARSKNLMGSDWEGDAATSYAAHRKDLVASLDAASSLASSISSTTTGMAGVVRVAQGNLDLAWAEVSGIEHTGSPSGDVRFRCEDDAELQRVNAAVARANEIRTELDSALATDRKALEDAVAQWDAITSAWAGIAEAGQDPFTLPKDSDGVGVITVDGHTYVNTGAGDDHVKITIDPATGDQIVDVNGTTYRVPKDQEIVVRTGEGGDVVEVPKGTRVNVTILGGEGDDKVQGGDGRDTILGGDGEDEVQAGAGDDVVLGGTGRDYVDGQTGNDLLAGGAGDDTVYGLDGDDRILGGSGTDYLEGGKDKDVVHGGSGDDVVSGGRDDDTLFGAGGDDVVYAGAGTDATYGGTGDDTANQEAGDTGEEVERTVTVQISDTARFINIEGSPEFVARVEADLDMLRSSPAGQQMLAAMQQEHDDSGFLGMFQEGVTIREHPGGDNNTADPDGNVIEYSPRRDESVDDRPPIVGLYHEMAHVYDYMTGNYDDSEYHGADGQDDGIEQGERTAVGLPVDHDDDPNTPEQRDPDHPYPLTENGLRDELGWDRREHYRG